LNTTHQTPFVGAKPQALTEILKEGGLDAWEQMDFIIYMYSHMRDWAVRDGNESGALRFGAVVLITKEVREYAERLRDEGVPYEELVRRANDFQSERAGQYFEEIKRRQELNDNAKGLRYKSRRKNDQETN